MKGILNRGPAMEPFWTIYLSVEGSRISHCTHTASKIGQQICPRCVDGDIEALIRTCGVAPLIKPMQAQYSSANHQTPWEKKDRENKDYLH
jgi:hypothetical protein